MQAGGAAPTSAPMSAPGSLPEQARYGADSVLMKSEKVLHEFFPQSGGDFSPGGSRVIRFDISSSDFMDLSEARLACTYTTGATTDSTILDGGLGGTIQSLTIKNSAGQQLEIIDEYALIQSLLIQCSDRARMEQAQLYVEEMFIADSNNIPDADDTTYAINAATARNLTHKFHGAWFQSTKKKLLPPGVAFKVEIQLVANANDTMSNRGNNANDFTLSNVSIQIPTVRIMNQAFEDQTARMLARGYRWTGATYRAYNHSLDQIGARNLVIADKSLALTGMLGVARLTASIGDNQLLQNYVREGAAFENDYNLTIGSKQYPPVKIDYVGSNAQTVSESNATFELATNLSQVSAVLGNVPYSGNVVFGTDAADNVAPLFPGDNIGRPAANRGTGFLAVQVGYQQGVGMDTQTASLPVIFNFQTRLANLTFTAIAQATATFSMQPEQGMLMVRSFI